ncbi:hypothetical protein BEWA_014600 [Theileria equi strain WA]|uniref:Prolactin regulatory element-binding protein n=1 Tax=Theileria equi strain WA TaxID=1537102 RepID=L1LC35_THEEQ|nr:hypothetical protein BEWA_014600 [Theileria equi strain WA]EKX72901.1 hypothetical protein BEWA_014600 [Theileria equi strain WA]|eukprot:XP_004832353.1 hypothetical protein BEWA_014600 [Theileria equi strain WA]
MGGKTKIFPYPVYALSYGDGYIVASGGGGGDDYGISDRIEVYTFGNNPKSNDLHLKSTTTEQNGVLDSIDFLPKHKLWIGSLDDSTLLFSYNPKRGFRILAKFKTDQSKKDPKLTACRFGGNRDMFVTCGNDGCVRVWKLTDKLLKQIRSFHDQSHSDDGESTPQYPPTEISSPCPIGGIGDLTVEPSPIDPLSLEDSLSDTVPSVGNFGDPNSADFEDIQYIDRPPADQDGAVEGTSKARERKKNMNKYQTEGSDMVKLVLKHNDHKKLVNDSCISGDSKLLVSVSANHIIAYNMNPARFVCEEMRDWNFKFCRFIDTRSCDGKYTLLTCEWTNKKPMRTTASLWFIDTDHEKFILLKHVKVGEVKCSALALSGGDSCFALGFGTGLVSIYRAPSMSLIRSETRHMFPVTDLAFTSTKLISSGADFYVVTGDIYKSQVLKYITMSMPIAIFISVAIKLCFSVKIERFKELIWSC